MSLCYFHSVGITLGKDWSTLISCPFLNSIGGLILDKTVTDPNFEGMAVFTPVINGMLGMGVPLGVLCMLLFIPPLPPKGSGIHCCPYTEISVQVPAPIMSRSEATGPHHVPACVLKCLWREIAARRELCKKVNSISESTLTLFITSNLLGCYNKSIFPCFLPSTQ